MQSRVAPVNTNGPSLLVPRALLVVALVVGSPEGTIREERDIIPLIPPPNGAFEEGLKRRNASGNDAKDQNETTHLIGRYAALYIERMGGQPKMCCWQAWWQRWCVGQQYATVQEEEAEEVEVIAEEFGLE